MLSCAPNAAYVSKNRYGITEDIDIPDPATGWAALMNAIRGDNKIADRDGEADGTGRKLTKEERAIFIEADALQIEMGNIIGRQGANGNVLYDSAKSSQHKDRASSLMMGIHYISGLEEDRKRRLIRGNANMIWGITGSAR